MIKRITPEIESFKYSGEPVRFTIGTIVLVVFCILLIIMSTFTQLPILDIFSLKNQADGFSLSNYLVDTSCYFYIPQLPAVFFVIALLDRKFGLLTIILYIIIGLCGLPIFGMGGGIHYISEYGFGYILAYIPATFITATIIKHNIGFLNVLKAVIIGVLTIHILGVFYMLFISTLFNTSFDMITGWIASQSGVKIIYDIIFCIISIYFAKFIKRFIWLIMC